MDLKRMRELAGVPQNESEQLDEVQGASSLATEGIIKKLAKKTKIGDYEPREVYAALSAIEPGWQFDIKIGTVPLRDGSINKTMSDVATAKAWAKAHGLTDCDFAYFSTTNAGFNIVYGNLDPKQWPNAPKEKPSDAFITAVSKEFLDTLLVNTEQAKDPKNPVEGRFYINPLGKPQVIDRDLQKEWGFPEGARQLIVSWKLSGVRKTVEVAALTSPKGLTINLEGAPAGLWSWLYKTDIAEKAQAYLDNNGVTAKDAAQKLLKGYNANEVIGTCGICRHIQKLRSAKLVLHGYVRPGYGWIQGSCFGVGYGPWELTTKSVEDYIAMLDKKIPQWKSHITTERAVKQYEVFIDDRFFLNAMNEAGVRRYSVSDHDFVLIDTKRYSRKEAEKEPGKPIIRPGSLEPRAARQAFQDVKEYKLRIIEQQLDQMQEVRRQFAKDLTVWQQQPLPGKQLESADAKVHEFRQISGMLR